MDIPRGHRRRILTALPATLPDEEVPEDGRGKEKGKAKGTGKGKGKGPKKSAGGTWRSTSHVRVQLHPCPPQSCHLKSQWLSTLVVSVNELLPS